MKNKLARIFSRRDVLALFRATGTTILVVGCIPRKQTVAVSASSVSGCVVSPEQTEGPYFVDEKLQRSDIRSDPADNSVKAGTRLDLTLHISQVGSGGCTPLVNAMVDIWHCDALGIYSDVADPSFNTAGQKFLRGYQVSDTNGTVKFTTIYPGWYEGRTVHIHFKVRTDGISGQRYEFTSQLYFDDSITDDVHQKAPYASKGQRTQKNADDRIFTDGGEQMLLKLVQNKEGYAGTFDVGLEIT
ncbi:intradiol ring-cleavage dioxygenase [Nostoc sp. 2RC]|uniref:intradiol ring-cleavage dioxygenase n=1 Tax=Nostoc sp. 2RC TaxID=2485484 RepID=UPI00162ACA64|nr:intradiol ring-cleavage dioxygenase [Nostoc sp. 2RC]MBC1237939.1 intradiol ring-cleavage dioxygenase [Nostoc sp. 2RC]